MVEWRLRFLDDPDFNPKQLVDFSKLKKDTLFFHPGRGWGKNVTGVNWLAWELCRRSTFGHVIAPTHNDLRYVIFEGESGILRWVPSILVRHYNSSDMVMEFYNGSVLRGFSAEKPERLRGPQCELLWEDEIAAWLRMRETHEQAIFGLRLGARPLHLITSTPQPKELIRELMADPSIIKVGGHQRENKHLPPRYLEKMQRLAGTRLGRQELAGELIDAEELGVVQRSQWKRFPHDKPLPAFETVIMSLDTALGEENVDVKKQKTDYTACTVWGCWRERPKNVQDLPERLDDLLVIPQQQSKILLLDAWAERLGFPDLIKRIKREKEQRYGNDTTVFRPALGDFMPTGMGRKPDLILIEDKNSGISARQQLRSENIPVQPYDPADQNKYLRLNLCAPMFVGGFVHAVASEHRPNEFKSWAEPVIAQMCSYSGEGSLEHDDLMDSATQALLWLQRNWLRLAPPVHTRRGIIRTPVGENPYLQ
jgi:phage terminase large subunit-like protein